MTGWVDWSRRRALGAIAAAAGAPLAMSACAEAPASAPRELVSINMAGAEPPPPAAAAIPGAAPGPLPQGDAGALLESAFDQALRMTAPIYLNGLGPFPFVIDTGANRSVVSREVAQVCGLAWDGSAPMHGIAGEEPAPLVKVARLRVGQVLSANLRLPVLPRSRLGADGLLGVDMLHDRRIRLDFKAAHFEITASDGATLARGSNSRLADPNGPVTVPAHYRFGQLVIFDANAVGRPVTAFLDSGSQITVGNMAMRKAILEARPDLSPRFIETELFSATAQHAHAQLALLPDLRLGGQQITNLVAAFADLHIFDLWDLRAQPTILIGVDVLRRFDQVVLDFGRREVSFWPPRGARRVVGP
jgi:hypothetical protein